MSKEKFEQEKLTYDIQKSIIDEKNKCVRVPVNLDDLKHMISVDDAGKISYDISKKYPNIKFTNRWDTVSDDEDVKEYLFFYE